MRRALTVGVLVVALLPTHRAAAQCGTDGTIPGTSSSVTTVETPAATFYIDDRDALDLDDDGEAESVWIYQESNGVEGLQRGGEAPWFVHVQSARATARDALTLHVDPIPVAVPDPDDPDGPPRTVTLFPYGFDFPPPCTMSQCVPLLPYEWQDHCNESATPDTLVF